MNMTNIFIKALQAGYDERCGNYLILLHNVETILTLFHEGDENRLMNTRARFFLTFCHSKTLHFLLASKLFT